MQEHLETISALVCLLSICLTTFTHTSYSVKKWLDANPNEVISILMVNIDNQAPSVYAPIFESAGIANMSYAPPTGTVDGSQWPTLGELIVCLYSLYIVTGFAQIHAPRILERGSSLSWTPMPISHQFRTSSKVGSNERRKDAC